MDKNTFGKSPCFHVDITMMKNFEDPEIIEAYKQMCEAKPKNQIQLSNGAVLTVNTYKMYANINYHYPQEHMDTCWPGWISPTNMHNANTRKMLMTEAISTGSRAYQRVPGAEPIGFVIEVEILNSFQPEYVYGASIKSHLDKWDRMKGLKVAYADLMKDFAKYSISLSKDERRKVAEIVGLS